MMSKPWCVLIAERIRPLLLLAALGLGACTMPVREMPQVTVMDAAAEQYVRLVLAVGEHDEHYVDAYYGPSAWREEVRAADMSLEAIGVRARAAHESVQAQPAVDDPLEQARQTYLSRQLQALIAQVRYLQHGRESFDAEAQALYDIAVPKITEAALDQQLSRIDALLPGEGTLAERYGRYLEQFSIPPERLDAVMRAAIAEARQRTAERITLPPGEQFELAFVKDKPWSAYNWYQGGYHSRIEINTDLPVSMMRAIELAVHEGYPGHHVYNALLEQKLVRERGWVEYSVYPLYSPQSLIAEGTADYAMALTFPRVALIAFVRETLFPLAGLDPAEAERYVTITAAGRVTGLATIEAARRYLDGTADATATQAFLQRYALASQARAEQRLRFFDSYRAYIVNYALGEQLVTAYIARQVGDDIDQRWTLFETLISTPRMPSQLVD